jgi:hypothetical protein
MLRKRAYSFLTSTAIVVVAVFGFADGAMAQQQIQPVAPPVVSPVTLALLQPGEMQPIPAAPVPVVKLTLAPFPETPVRHRFWDRENTVLLAANTAFAAADFVITRDNLRNGGQELDPVTRMFSGSTAGLSANFAGEAIGVVGLSYFFHRTGHHKLERAVSMLNLGSSATAVGFGLAHR